MDTHESHVYINLLNDGPNIYTVTETTKRKTMFPPIILRFLLDSDFNLYHSKVLTEIRPNPVEKINYQ